MKKISRRIKFHRHGSTPLFGTRRRVKGPVHAIAFAIGLAIWFLLLQNTVSPRPAAPTRVLQNATHRTADAFRSNAVAPKLTVTTGGRQDLRPMETPRGETNGSVRPVSDNTFEQMVALVVREPQRPMAAPPGETNASVRPVPDNTFEHIVALVVREPQRPMATPRGETNVRVRPVPDNTFEHMVALVVREPQRPMATPRGETNASVRPVPDNTSERMLTLVVRPQHADAVSAHVSKASAQKTPAGKPSSLHASGHRIQERPNGTASTRARRWAPPVTKTSPTAADQKRLFQSFSARSLSDSRSREPR
jgi:hypothetical protein